MPRARNRWERAVQVFRWAQEVFHLPDDTVLECVSDIDDGDTFGRLVERSGRYIIQLSDRACRTNHDAVFNMLHECAHLRLQRQGLGDYHGPFFWTAFGEMVDAFDAHGEADSRTYPTE